MLLCMAGLGDTGSMKPSDWLTSANHSTNILGQHISRTRHNDAADGYITLSLHLFYSEAEMSSLLNSNNPVLLVVGGG